MPEFSPRTVATVVKDRIILVASIFVLVLMMIINTSRALMITGIECSEDKIVKNDGRIESDDIVSCVKFSNLFALSESECF